MRAMSLRFTARTAAVFCAGIFFFTLPQRGKAADSNEPRSEKVTDSSTPADVFEAMRKNFHSQPAKGVHIRYQFDISGPAGGSWWIIVDDGDFTMGKGATEKPDVVMAASDKDWVMLSTGALGGFRAYLTGRLKVTGDQSLARKLNEIFP